MASPVIKELGNMSDILCMFGTAQQEIIVLGTIIFSLQKANLIKKGSLHNHKMTDVINTMQVVRIKVRLKMRIQTFSLDINNVFIGI